MKTLIRLMTISVRLSMRIYLIKLSPLFAICSMNDLFYILGNLDSGKKRRYSKASHSVLQRS